MKYAPRKPWTEERKQEAISHYQTGMSVQAVVHQMRTNIRNVMGALHSAGVIRDKKTHYLGQGNPSWRGGRIIDKTGYVLLYVPTHPAANSGGYVREHRLVMEKKLGRLLTPLEVVHHMDKNKENNHPDNLQLHACNAEHLHEELKGHVPNWTPEGRQRLLSSAARKKEAAKKRRTDS